MCNLRSFPAPVIGWSFCLKRTVLLDLVLTLSKKLVDSLGASLSLVLQVFRPFHLKFMHIFSYLRTYGPGLKINLDAMYITYTLSKIG